MPSVKNIKADQDNGKDAIPGTYRARVESNLDPLHLGRVKIRIPQLHGIPGEQDTALSNEALPWATPITMTGAGYNHGNLIVPETGDYVFVIFENGDRNSPAYLGGCYGIPQNSKTYGNIGDSPSAQSEWKGKGWTSAGGMNEVPPEAYPVGDAPNGKILYKSPKGFTIMTDETDDQEVLIICDNDNQSIKIDNPSDDHVSDVSITGKDGQTIHVITKPGEPSKIILLSADQKTKIELTNDRIYMMSPKMDIEIEHDINVTCEELNITASKSITISTKATTLTSDDTIDMTTDKLTVKAGSLIDMTTTVFNIHATDTNIYGNLTTSGGIVNLN